MVSTEKNHEILFNAYNEIVRQFIILHNIIEIVCNDHKEHYFDKIVLNDDNTINVWSHGMKWDKLLFDFSLDFAAMIYYMEEELFYVQHKTIRDNAKYSFIFKE